MDEGKTFVFIRRRLVEQRVYVTAENATEALKLAKAPPTTRRFGPTRIGEVRRPVVSTDDEITLNTTWRRDRSDG